MAGIELLISSICYNATFCDAYYDNSGLDERLTKKQNEFLALRSEVNGKHLRIATYNNYPLSYVEEINGTLVGQGVAFVIVDILRKRFNFTFDVILAEKNYESGGSKPEDSVIGLVNSSIADFAAAFLPILYDYQTKVSFSHLLDEGVWLMMLKRPKESAAGSGLLAPFEYEVWYLILAAVLSYGPCITLLTKLRNKLVTDEEAPIPISPSFWFVYGAFIKQGTTMSPEANTTRVLFATWWMFIILLSAFYTANLTAFLTLSKFTLDIEYPQDLLRKNYRWMAQEGGTVQYIVRDPNEELHSLNVMVKNGRAEFRSISNDFDYLPLVQGGAVLVREETAVLHLMYGDYLRKAREGVEEADRCTYVVAPNAFMTTMRAFAYPRNSTLRRLFDPVLNYVEQAGLIKHHLHRDLPSTKICPLDLQSKDRRLRNSDLLMTYLIMLAGLAAATAAFMGEMIFKRYIRVKWKVKVHSGLIGQKKKSQSKKKETKKRWTDDTKPPPYESLFGRNSRYTGSENTEHKVINGREYWVVNTISGDRRLIPIRTPSAFLYERK
ncbi:glutamate receptor ionotropic, delta-1 [Plutella xylostella]|uniref:glutamate receptor ionotropic, delta-1 n=1 Tax=Plutella xylostella TaxID=51655 RepID=UPI002032FA59|nr:glutamate receptor ionotropic, delta-1 [Plutella xylostella]